MKIIKMSGIIMGGVIILFGGCAKIKEWHKKMKTNIETTFKVPERAIVAAIPYDDFPPPLNFYLVKDESWSYKDGNDLYAKIIYEGNAKIPLIINFYNNILPHKNWQLTEQKEVDNYAYLSFTNQQNKHTATIVIKYIPKGTRIIIQIKPI